MACKPFDYPYTVLKGASGTKIKYNKSTFVGRDDERAFGGVIDDAMTSSGSKS